jgi:pSer/pThr/pTyr-binding forkhead associated (FHA) protein
MTRSGHIVRFALDPSDPVLREGNFVIGRSTACNAVIADDSVSRSHAMCIVRADQYLIRDLQSRNLTKINGVPLAPDRPRPLQAGDIVHFGEIEMVVASA